MKTVRLVIILAVFAFFLGRLGGAEHNGRHRSNGAPLSKPAALPGKNDFVIHSENEDSTKKV
jgi:hypothetical protein